MLSSFRSLRATLVFIQIGIIIFSSSMLYFQQEDKIQDEVTNKMVGCIIDFLFYCSQWMILLHISLMADFGVDIMLLVHALIHGLDLHIVDNMQYYYAYQRGHLSKILAHVIIHNLERISYFFFGVPTYILIVHVLSVTYQILLQKKNSTTNALWKYLVALAVFMFLQSLTITLLTFYELTNIFSLTLIRAAMESFSIAAFILFETYIISFINPYKRWRKCVLGISYRHNLLQKGMMLLSGIFIGRGLSSLIIGCVVSEISPEDYFKHFLPVGVKIVNSIDYLFVILKALRMPAFWYYCFSQVNEATKAQEVPDRVNPYSAIIEIPEDFDEFQE